MSMHDSTQTSSPSRHVVIHPHEAQERVQEARQLFQRTLSKWAGDMLVLRSQAFQEPRWPDEVDPGLLGKAA